MTKQNEALEKVYEAVKSLKDLAKEVLKVDTLNAQDQLVPSGIEILDLYAGGGLH